MNLDPAMWPGIVSRAGGMLLESLDLQETLDRVLGTVVPELADWAAIDVLEPGGRLRTVTVTHADPARLPLVELLRGQYTHAEETEARTVESLRTRPPMVIEDVTDAMLVAAAAPPMLATIRALAPHSTVTVPLRRHGVTFGSLVAFWAQSKRSYTLRDVTGFEELGRRAAIAIENAQLYERACAVADTFAHAALPASLPSVDGLIFDAIYEPAGDETRVGGDWYDVLRLRDGRILITIGDVAGTGLDAAVLMSAVRHVLRGLAQLCDDPVGILDAADATLRLTEPDTIITAVVAIVDPIEMTLAYATAGHPPPLLRCANGSIVEFASGDLPLGLRFRSDAITRTVELETGSRVVFYTDGVIEARRDLIAGMAALRLAVADLPPGRSPARSLFAGVLADVHDDVAILTLTCDGNPALGPDRISFAATDPEAGAAVRAALVRRLGERGAQPDERACAELVLGELLANAVRYARGQIDVVFEWNGPTPIVHVLDRGPGFRLPAGSLRNPYDERGRGLAIAAALAENVNVTPRRGGGAHVRAVLSIGSLPRLR